MSVDSHPRRAPARHALLTLCLCASLSALALGCQIPSDDDEDTPAGDLPSGVINALTPAQRAEYCEAQAEILLSSLNPAGAEFSAATAKSCLLVGLFDGTDQMSCEGIQAESANATVASVTEDCLGDEDFFSACGVTASEASSCQLARLRFQLQAFSTLDLSAYSCANAGNFEALMPLLTQFSAITPPADLCSAEALACFETDSGEEGERFMCADGSEDVPESWVCDGGDDCADGSDEVGCVPFMCADGTGEVPPSWVCDGEEDCTDGSDEASCGG